MTIDYDAVRQAMLDIEAKEGNDAADTWIVTARILDLPPDDNFLEALKAEVTRTNRILHAVHMEQSGVEPTPGNLLALGFMQGVTFARAIERVRGGDPVEPNLAEAIEALKETVTAGNEFALRLADAAEVIMDAAPVGELKDPDALVSALDYALRGNPGCIEPEEWEERRRQALATHGERLGIGEAGIGGELAG